MVETFGFIGLGSQGAPMARRMIDAGLDTVLWARRPETLEPFSNRRVRFAATLAELGAQVQHVGVCVLSDTDVQEVCGELIVAMRPGSRIAIHSTALPEICRNIAKRAASRGIAVLDAPVSGGAPAAEAGALTVMVGGEADAFEAARPAFTTFGRLIVHVGPLGSGQLAKLVNNTLMAANMGLADAAISAGHALGLAPEMLARILKESSGRSFGLEVRARMTSPNSFVHGAALLSKDVRLLGEAIGSSSSDFERLRNAALPFLTLAADK